jgi:hypothetical protein
MKTNKYISLFIAIVLSAVVQAQNVGINASGATPNTSAMLDVNSSTKGVLIPQVALTSITDVTTITSGNVNSLLVYNTATAGTSPNNVIPAYYYWNATAGKWFQIAASSGSTGNNMFSGFQVFTASGTFIIPTGVSRVMIEMWGGGGGGGASSGGANYAGDGGGGGAYAKSLFNVTANITVTIGTGGAGGTSPGGNGGAGVTTSVSGGAVLTAGGGSGGKGNDINSLITAGGIPTATSASCLGINGYPGAGELGGATGGEGGAAPAGGAGGQANGTPGNAGAIPGGGGGGASQTNAGGASAGGAGAAGLVIIWW